LEWSPPESYLAVAHGGGENQKVTSNWKYIEACRRKVPEGEAQKMVGAVKIFRTTPCSVLENGGPPFSRRAGGTGA